MEQLTMKDRKIITLGLYNLSRSMRKNPEAVKDISETAERFGVTGEFKKISQMSVAIDKIVDGLKNLSNTLEDGTGDAEADRMIEAINKASKDQKPDLN